MLWLLCVQYTHGRFQSASSAYGILRGLIQTYLARQRNFASKDCVIILFYLLQLQCYPPLYCGFKCEEDTTNANMCAVSECGPRSRFSSESDMRHTPSACMRTCRSASRQTDITVLSFRLANRSDSYKKGDIFRHRQYVCVCLCVCVCVCIRQCEDTGFSEFLAVLWNIGQYIIIYKLAYLYIFM